MSEKKPTPVLRLRNERLCPVCGKRSYSAGGIHPQCAMKQADESIVREPRPKVKAPPRQRSWSKKCPKCDAMMHVRKQACECGYKWPAT